MNDGNKMGAFNYYCPKCKATKIVDHEAPYIICNNCTTQMIRIINGKNKSIQRINKSTTKI